MNDPKTTRYSMKKTASNRGKTHLGAVLEDVEETDANQGSTAVAVGTGNEIVKTISQGNIRLNGAMINDRSKPTDRVAAELVISEVIDLCREVRSSRSVCFCKYSLAQWGGRRVH